MDEQASMLWEVLSVIGDYHQIQMLIDVFGEEKVAKAFPINYEEWREVFRNEDEDEDEDEEDEEEEEKEEEEEEPTFAKAIILGAGDNKAKKITWGINTKEEDLDLYFPKAKVPMGLDRIEYWTTQKKTGIFDYYVVMYDGHNKGEPNQISKFITNVLPYGVFNTGNFVILHKVWKNDEEFNTDITIGLKELKNLFT